jgi:hypothetical protein
MGGGGHERPARCRAASCYAGAHMGDGGQACRLYCSGVKQCAGGCCTWRPGPSYCRCVPEGTRRSPLLCIRSSLFSICMYALLRRLGCLQAHPGWPRCRWCCACNQSPGLLTQSQCFTLLRSLLMGAGAGQVAACAVRQAPRRRGYCFAGR